MIDLVKTHLTHPWGPPWTLETLGGPWRPLATLGDMLENDQFPPKWLRERSSIQKNVYCGTPYSSIFQPMQIFQICMQCTEKVINIMGHFYSIIMFS